MENNMFDEKINDEILRKIIERVILLTIVRFLSVLDEKDKQKVIERLSKYNSVSDPGIIS